MPISSFKEQLIAIKDIINPNALVVDVCSVSVMPADSMRMHLPETNDLLSTHPMFGPDSTKDATTFKDLKFIFCPLRIKDEKRVNNFLDFWKNLGCDMIQLTPEEHDMQAAYTHAFAFLIGKIGINLNIRRNHISTKGFEGILYNQTAVENDTGQLFNDMMTYNPYAKEMRKKVLQALEDIESQLKD